MEKELQEECLTEEELQELEKYENNMNNSSKELYEHNKEENNLPQLKYASKDIEEYKLRFYKWGGFLFQLSSIVAVIYIIVYIIGMLVEFNN